MWKQEPSAEFERRLKKFAKKHRNELKAVLRNLERYFAALDEGTQPAQVQGGFIHHEPDGVIALDQKGGGPNLAQTRLYVYPHVPSSTLHLLTLGGKDTQHDDIQFCKRVAKALSQQESASSEDASQETGQAIPKRHGDDS